MRRNKDIKFPAVLPGFLKKTILPAILVLLSLVLTWVVHQPVITFPSYIDWNTMYTLTGLLIVTTGIRESGFFHVTAYRLSRKIRNERFLSLFLIFSAAFLSTFLTNDIALFIIVPLTLGFQDILRKDLSKIIIFEALAVNAGSALTPIGNPQNIFLWHQWDNSFFSFVKDLFPLVLIMLIWLFLFTFLVFPPEGIKADNRDTVSPDKKLFYLSLSFLVFFIFFIEMDLGAWFLPVIIITYLLYSVKVFLRADWVLLFLFLFIFVDIELMCQLPVVSRFLSRLSLQDPGSLYLTGALGSQVLSNVPATVLLTHYTDHFKVLAYAVNTGGNGLLFASFANLIALRFIRNKKKYLQFHIYSILYFLITLVTVWFLLIRQALLA